VAVRGRTWRPSMLGDETLALLLGVAAGAVLVSMTYAEAR
jgi:hypothetical protein